MRPLQTSTLTLDQALRQAIIHHQEGKLKEAEDIYRAILKTHPNQSDAHHNLGVLALKVNQPIAGLKHFQKALEGNPDNTQYWLGYIDALLQAGQTAVARKTLEQGLLRGLQSEAVEVLIERLAKAEKVTESLSADHLHDKSPSPQEISALVSLFSRGHYEEAVSQAQAMIARFPKHGFGWKVMGSALKQTGRIEEALSAMQKAVIFSPGDAEAHVNLGLILAEISSLGEAEASYRRAIEIKPNYPEAHSMLGNVLKDMGRLKQAEVSYLNALRIKPDLAYVHNNLGVALSNMGQLEEAVACYQRALALQSDYLEAHFNLGNVLKEMRRPKEAETSYLNALEIKPDLVVALNNLGDTYKDMGRLEEAEAYFRRALHINPDYFLTLCNLGVVLRDMGKFTCAASYFRHALEIKSISHDNLVTANIGLADTLSRLVSGWHVPMMNDALRNNAYQEALRSAVSPETNALEIGTGSGLLAMMTARFGAGQITTCESVPFIASKAQEIIEANELSTLIRIIPKKSTEIHVGNDLPQRANLLVSEIFSSELLGEGVLPSIEDAKKRLLTSDARIIPAIGKIVFALFDGEGVKKHICVEQVFGFDLSKFNDITAQKRMLYRNDLPINLLTDSTEAFSFDFTKHDHFPSECKILRLPIKASGRCYGAIQWIRLHMDSDVVFENSPSIKAESSGWQQCLYRFPEPVDVVAGQTAVITVAHNRAAVWFTLDRVED